MGSIRGAMLDSDAGYRFQSAYATPWPATRSPPNGYNDGYQTTGYEAVRDPYRPSSVHATRANSSASPFGVTNGMTTPTTAAFHNTPRSDQPYPYSPPQSYAWQQSAYQSPTNTYGPIGSSIPSYTNITPPSTVNGAVGSVLGHNGYRVDDDLAACGSLANSVAAIATEEDIPHHRSPPNRHRHSSYSPPDSADDADTVSPSMSDLSMDVNCYDKSSPPPLLAMHPQPLQAQLQSSLSLPLQSLSGAQDAAYLVNGCNGMAGAASGYATTAAAAAAAAGAGGSLHEGNRGRQPRRGGNRDEFDGPHQLLPRPAPQYVARQERELPHLPTHLRVEEQDHVLSQVNDRLSQCAFDFVARYQFPIPLTQDMRRVARPQDREWTEWVQLLKRLATKRRIPARVLYNNQIKQFVTILENSLEMRHAARHQSRPLKDDRNILQLISAGIQVAKILKDAPAMEVLDQLYMNTERQIQERSAMSAAALFRN